MSAFVDGWINKQEREEEMRGPDTREETEGKTEPVTSASIFFSSTGVYLFEMLSIQMGICPVSGESSQLPFHLGGF